VKTYLRKWDGRSGLDSFGSGCGSVVGGGGSEINLWIL
jgi:hypothetical protein